MTVGDVLEYTGAAEPVRDAGGAEGSAPRGAAPTILLSATGELFLRGWIDDRSAPLRCVRVVAPGLSKTIGSEGIGRFQSDNDDGSESLGVWATTPFDAAGLTVVNVEFVLKDGQTTSHEVAALRNETTLRRPSRNVLGAAKRHRPQPPAKRGTPRTASQSRPPEPLRPFPKSNVEAILVAEDGGVFIAGWIDDALDPLQELTLNGHGWRIVFEGERSREPAATMSTSR